MYSTHLGLVFDYDQLVTQVFLDDVQYYIFTFLVAFSFCNFAIKLHDARRIFFAQVTLHNMLIFKQILSVNMSSFKLMSNYSIF